MVVLIALFQSTKNADSIGLVRFLNHHGLESTLKSLILLEILLIFVERCGTNSPQLSTSQSWFQDVGSIHGTFATSCTNESVNLIDEEYDIAFGTCHLFDNGLQSFLKLALIFCTSYQCTHIERI